MLEHFNHMKVDTLKISYGTYISVNEFAVRN